MQSERILLLVAHPDDETIAAGAHLKYWPDVTIVHVTDGAPRDQQDAINYGFANWQAYREHRQCEMDRALEIGDSQHCSRRKLGIADQEAVFHLAEIMDELRGFDPSVVITHAYEGGHPDHDACALAAAIIWGETGRLWEFAGYHNSAWGMETGCFLDGLPSAPPSFPVLPHITGDDLLRKRRMLESFQSQQNVLNHFDPAIEAFRPAPAYDFDRPPHEGALMYEAWGFALNGSRWREIAAAVGRSACH